MISTRRRRVPSRPRSGAFWRPNGAVRFTTGSIDSHEDLGINAKPADRISLQTSATCSPVHYKDLVKPALFGNYTFLEFFMGPIPNIGQNFTWDYNVLTGGTSVTYQL